MITEKDLQEAIAECQGVRNPNASTCLKLASFLTIQREMFGAKEEPRYSYDPPNNTVVDYYSDTEFGSLIEGKKQADIWPILDELMSTIQVVEPRLYAAVIRKINA